MKSFKHYTITALKVLPYNGFVGEGVLIPYEATVTVSTWWGRKVKEKSTSCMFRGHSMSIYL